MERVHGNKGKPSKLRGRSRGYEWVKAHVGYRYDDCLKYPFGHDGHGYGTFGLNGRVLKAHRVMCELVHGPSPGPGYEAAHSCGRGHQRCINPRHISWKTRSGNQQDRTDSYGRGAPRYKLTEEDVAQIRNLLPTETNRAIAKQFDVTPGLISKIRHGKLWYEGRKRHFVPLSDEKVVEIRGLFGKKPMREIAKEYGVPESKIHKIKYGGAHDYARIR